MPFILFAAKVLVIGSQRLTRGLFGREEVWVVVDVADDYHVVVLSWEVGKVGEEVDPILFQHERPVFEHNDPFSIVAVLVRNVEYITFKSSFVEKFSCELAYGFGVYFNKANVWFLSTVISSCVPGTFGIPWTDQIWRGQITFYPFSVIPPLSAEQNFSHS